jgi:hypothetical protein
VAAAPLPFRRRPACFVHAIPHPGVELASYLVGVTDKGWIDDIDIKLTASINEDFDRLTAE